MSQREKPADPKPYYEAHVFCCTNRRPAGHPRGCCAERDGEARGRLRIEVLALAPFCAKASAISRPIPGPIPVMTATLSLMSMKVSSLRR